MGQDVILSDDRVAALVSVGAIEAGAALIGKVEVQNDLDFTKTVTIANGAFLSGAVDLGAGRVLVGIIFPGAWTTASLTLQAAAALDGTYGNLTDEDGAEVELAAVVAGQYRSVGRLVTNLRGARYLKFRSGTSVATVAQAGGDVLTLVTAAM